MLVFKKNTKHKNTKIKFILTFVGMNFDFFFNFAMLE